MYLSELAAAAATLETLGKGALVNTVYRSSGGTLVKLYGARGPLEGFFFSTTKRVFFPVHDIAAFPREEITTRESALRKYLGGKTLTASALAAAYGRVVTVQFGAATLVVPLFAGKAVHLRDEAGALLWQEHPDSTLEPLAAPLGGKEPRVEDPFAWQERFLADEAARRAEEHRRRIEALRRTLTDRIAKMRAEQARALERAERHRADAELIKRWLYTLPAHERRASLTLHDGTAQEKTLSLDPERTIAENMNDLFAEAKRLRRGAATLEQRIAENERTLAALDETPPPVPRRDDQPRRAALADGRRRRPYRRFRAPSGRLFFVGKSAADNDELTFKVSSPHDLWFHAQGEAGSHVLLRKGKGEVATEEEVFLGCCLALFYSKARAAMTGEVWFTERKFVRKKKGMPPGMVLITQGKSKFIRTDASFFAKLEREDADD